MRMRQDIAEFESAFVQETAADRLRREELRRAAITRAQKRHVARRNQRGTMRFALLVLTLLATAVIVAVAMFQTLYYVMG
jgi:hypothetical protein